jgi:two-component system chemotaxis response regulator CheB
LLALRHAGALTIAQDETSSVIFGMPREAIEIGAADRVLRLDDIAPALAVAGARPN